MRFNESQRRVIFYHAGSTIYRSGEYNLDATNTFVRMEIGIRNDR